MKENTRLHRLAENPLLLTVITALYRSQRLPEKRVQVYDKCAELLLETWANIKGTNARWSEMKLGRDDQFACVAHLGFKLHQRSQDESATQKQNRPDSEQDTATDVPERLLLKEIETFLDDRKLISEKAERRKEAERFMELMRIEAGLIVERGTDENGENIYGFVHRTFQEYFAAADVYERYRQDEDPEIIKDFLVEHLHDPHWQEVILLLLGKLGRKPVTLRLRDILNGTIKSRRSRYTDLVQQDLFFVCDCLIEELPVESDLAELVIARLSDLVITSPFPLQRSNAVDKLGDLIQTKQCLGMASKDLVRLAKLETITDINLKIKIAESLYFNSLENSEEKREATLILTDLLHCEDILIGQVIQVAGALYSVSLNSEEKPKAKQILMELIQRKDISMEQAIQAATVFYSVSFENFPERQEATLVLIGLTRREDISVEQVIQVAEILYIFSFENVREKQKAAQILIELVRRKDILVEQTIQATAMLYRWMFTDAEKLQEARQILIELIRRKDISMEQTIQAAEVLYSRGHTDTEERQEARQMLIELAHRENVPIEQTIQAAEVLYSWGPEESAGVQEARQMLIELAHQEDISIEHAIKAAEALYRYGLDDSEERQLAIQVLINLVRRKDISIEQVIKVVKAFYTCSSKDSEERQQALQMLWQLTQYKRLTEDQHSCILTVPIATGNANYSDKAQALDRLFALLPSDQITNYVEEHWPDNYLSDIQPEELPYVVAIAKQQLLPLRVRNYMYSLMRNSVPQFDKIPSSDDTIAL